MARPYHLGARAQASTERRERILRAMSELLAERRYDDIALASVAERAGVGLATLTRNFPTKAALLVATTEWWAPREEALREVVPSDIAAVVAVLSTRYESIAESVRRNLDLDERVPEMTEAYQIARASHLRWLGEAFRRWLPRRGRVRELRLRALFGATEIYGWWSLRHRLGATPDEARAVMQETLQALVHRWERG